MRDDGWCSDVSRLFWLEKDEVLAATEGVLEGATRRGTC